jgi:protein transport protein SEC61 subunit alpha
VWRCFNPSFGNYGKGTEFEGAVIALVHLLITRTDKGAALREAFTRENFPNMANMLATIIVFLIVVYFQGFRVELALKHHKYANYNGNYPIKLFYTSNTPIILQSALVSITYFVSQMLYTALPNFFLIRLIGVWTSSERGQKVPIGGLVYFLSPPQSFTELLSDPLHGIIYLAFTLGTSALFSRLWIQMSNTTAKDVAQQFKQQEVFLGGFREQSTIYMLNQYIPIAATFGGMCVGLLTVIADFTGFSLF